MKKQTLILSLGLLTFTAAGFAQDKMEVKDNSNNLLMQVNDEGAAGSVTLPDVVSDPSSTTNKLYNKSGALYFNGNVVGGSGGAVYGWAKTVTGQSLHSSTTFFFGESTGEMTSGNGVTWDDANNRFLVQQAGLYFVQFDANYKLDPVITSTSAFVTIRTASEIITYVLESSKVVTVTITAVVSLNANGQIQGSVEFTGATNAALIESSMFIRKLD